MRGLGDIPYIAVTPPVWVQDYADNFAVLQGIALSPDDPLYPQLAAIKQAAGDLHFQIRTAIAHGQQNADAGNAELHAIAPRAVAWLAQVEAFARAMRSRTTVAPTLTALVNTAEHWVDGLRNFENWTAGQFQAAAQAFANLAAMLDTLGKALAEIPWLWIGAGLLALILLPRILEAVDE